MVDEIKNIIIIIINHCLGLRVLAWFACARGRILHRLMHDDVPGAGLMQKHAYALRWAGYPFNTIFISNTLWKCDPQNS